MKLTDVKIWISNNVSLCRFIANRVTNCYGILTPATLMYRSCEELATDWLSSSLENSGPSILIEIVNYIATGPLVLC